jgi:hypothetical protein
MVASVVFQMQPAPEPVSTVAAPTDRKTDLTLYNKIIDRIAAGETYYSVAAQEQRAGNYPLRPFIVFRLPTLALAIYRPNRWWPSILAALIAVMIRETALPFALLMGALALWNRSWREALAWIGIVGLFALILALHAEQVAAVTLITDAQSPGWTNFSGWPFFVLAMRLTTALRGFPVWIAAPLIPLAMLGWASWRSRTGLAGFLLFCGYALIFMVLGRRDNFYWGLIVAPTFLLGLAFVPNTLSNLWISITTKAAPD